MGFGFLLASNTLWTAWLRIPTRPPRKDASAVPPSPSISSNRHNNELIKVINVCIMLETGIHVLSDEKRTRTVHRCDKHTPAARRNQGRNWRQLAPIPAAAHPRVLGGALTSVGLKCPCLRASHLGPQITQSRLKSALRSGAIPAALPPTCSRPHSFKVRNKLERHHRSLRRPVWRADSWHRHLRPHLSAHGRLDGSAESRQRLDSHLKRHRTFLWVSP